MGISAARRRHRKGLACLEEEEEEVVVAVVVVKEVVVVVVGSTHKPKPEVIKKIELDSAAGCNGGGEAGRVREVVQRC